MKTFTFGDWKLTAAPECGGNLASLYWRDHKITRSFDTVEEWVAPRACYGFPILFPPNRIEDGKFKLNGVEYSLPLNEPLRNNHIHGIPMERVWTLLNMLVKMAMLQLKISMLIVIKILEKNTQN
jgi:aldose 1-epimerase